jgi:hypothetical protein
MSDIQQFRFDQVAVPSRVSRAPMDESQALDALSNAINALAEKPLDFDYHVHHIRLAESLPEMEAEVTLAREMMSQFLAVGDDVWLPLLHHKERSVDLETEAGVTELLTLYERAEADYLCEYKTANVFPQQHLACFSHPNPSKAPRLRARTTLPLCL